MAENYGALLDRIQEEIPLSQITPDVVAKYLAKHDDRGKTQSRRKLGTLLSNTVQEERAISKVFTFTESFARERHIKLTEKTKGNIYKKWGRAKKEAVVIFKNGRIKAWRYIK